MWHWKYLVFLNKLDFLKLFFLDFAGHKIPTNIEHHMHYFSCRSFSISYSKTEKIQLKYKIKCDL